MHRRDFFASLPFLPALGLAGCGSSPLALGLHPWPGYEPLLLARHFGWLTDEVRLVEGRNASDSLRGLRNRSLDAACLTLDEVLQARSEGIALSVVLVLNESVGADAVLARPDIATLDALRGKSIGVEKTAVGALLLVELLHAAGLRRDDVTIVDLPADRHLAAWRDGQIDVAVTYDPTARMIQREGGRRLFDSRQIPGTIFDVLAVRPERLFRNAATLEAVIAAHFRALEHLRISREDALRRIAAWRGLSYAETVASYAGLHLPELTANRRMLAAGGEIMQAARRLSEVMHQNGLLAANDTLRDLIDPRLLPRRQA